MKALVVTLSAACAFAVAVPAQAKELSAFKACGVAGCKTVKDTSLLRKLIRSVEAQGNPVSVPIPAPAPYLRLEFWVRGDQAHGRASSSTTRRRAALSRSRPTLTPGPG